MPEGQGRSYRQKLKMLYLYRYLLDNTDENNYVTPKDIIEYMANRGIMVERKTVYKDVQLLDDENLLDLGARERDYDEEGLSDEEFEALDSKKYLRRNPIIYNRKEGEKGYRVYTRMFSLSDLQIIIDAVQTSKFITQDLANSLSFRLKGLASNHQRELLDRRCYTLDRARIENTRFVSTINEIHKAIGSDTKISFRYITHAKPDKPAMSRYIRTPVALLCYDGYYYLLATNNHQYRVDKIHNAKCMPNMPRGDLGVYENFNAQSAQDIHDRRFSAFPAKQEVITLRFDNKLLDAVADRYDIKNISPSDEGYFTITIRVETNHQFYGWLFGFGTDVKIISNTRVKESFKRYMKKVLEMYDDVAET